MKILFLNLIFGIMYNKFKKKPKLVAAGTQMKQSKSNLKKIHGLLEPSRRKQLVMHGTSQLNKFNNLQLKIIMQDGELK